MSLWWGLVAPHATWWQQVERRGASDTHFNFTRESSARCDSAPYGAVLPKVDMTGNVAQPDHAVGKQEIDWRQRCWPHRVFASMD
jgi:hypothetical protein